MFLVLGLTGKVALSPSAFLKQDTKYVRSFETRARPPIGRRRASICVRVTSLTWWRLPPHCRAWKERS